MFFLLSGNCVAKRLLVNVSATGACRPNWFLPSHKELPAGLPPCSPVWRDIWSHTLFTYDLFEKKCIHDQVLWVDSNRTCLSFRRDNLIVPVCTIYKDLTQKHFFKDAGLLNRFLVLRFADKQMPFCNTAYSTRVVVASMLCRVFVNEHFSNDNLSVCTVFFCMTSAFGWPDLSKAPHCVMRTAGFGFF